MPTRLERIKNSKEKQNDEFYTIYDDIANELPNYKEYFKGKRILCPCDWDESFEEQIVYSDGTEVFSNDLFNDSNFVKDININETKKSDIILFLILLYKFPIYVTLQMSCNTSGFF